MHSHERLRALLAGTCCTACGASLETGRMRVLAERPGLMFVELPCPECGSTALGMMTGPWPARKWACASTLAGMTQGERQRSAVAPPIDASDVLAMHELLREHRGGLRSLLDGTSRDPGGAGSRDRP